METKHFLISKEENDYKTQQINVEEENERIESGYRKLSDENISIIYLPDNIKSEEVKDVIINDPYKTGPNEDEVEFSEEINSVGENRNMIENLLSDKENIFSYIFKLNDTEASRSKPYFVNTPGIYLVFCKKDSLINLKVNNLENLIYDYENVSYILCDYYLLKRGGHLHRKEIDLFSSGFGPNRVEGIFKTRALNWNTFMKQNSINELFVCFVRMDNPKPIIEEIDKSLIYSPLMRRDEIVNKGFTPEHNLIVEDEILISDKHDGCVEFKVLQNQSIAVIADATPNLPVGICTIEIINPVKGQNLYIRNNGNPIRTIRTRFRTVSEYFNAPDTAVGLYKWQVVQNEMINKGIEEIIVRVCPIN